MNNNSKSKSTKKVIKLGVCIKRKVNRKLQARNNSTDVWFGLGMMGLIGWSVVIPTLLGAALGIWLDKQQDSYSFTLALILVGLCIGCTNAWYWMNNQFRDIEQGQEGSDNE